MVTLEFLNARPLFVWREKVRSLDATHACRRCQSLFRARLYCSEFLEDMLMSSTAEAGLLE